MSLDLRRDLHEYGDFMEETQGSLTVEQILRRSGTIQVIPDDERDPRQILRSRRWAAVLAVAAILLTVAVALVLDALRTEVPPADSTVPVPTTSPVSTPSSGPESTDQGTLDTPMGSFDWWHLAGLVGELPGTSWVVPTSTGYLMIDDEAVENATNYWRSSDGTVWSESASPGIEGSVASYQLIEGEHWVITETGAESGAFRSTDGETWLKVEMPSGLSGVRPIRLYEVDGQAMLVDAYAPGIWLYSVTTATWEEVTPSSVPESDMQDGPFPSIGAPATLGETTVLPWVLMPASQDGTESLRITLIVIGPGGQVESVRPPWDLLQAPGGWSGVTVVSAGGRFLAFLTYWVEDTTVIEMWTSTDGVAWTGPSRPRFLPAEGAGYLGRFQSQGDVIIAEVVDESFSGSVWISEDGVAWSDTGIQGANVDSYPIHGDGFIAFGSGGFYTSGGASGATFASADLRNWERVDAAEAGIWGTETWLNGYSRVGTAGNAIFFMSHWNDSRDLWVLKRSG